MTTAPPTPARTRTLAFKIIAGVMIVGTVLALAAAGGSGIAELQMRATANKPAASAPPPPAKLDPEDLNFRYTSLADITHPQTFEILSLDPEGDESSTAFHHYRELGRTRVGDAKSQTSATQAIIAAAKERPASINACVFNPRHGLHIVSDQGTVDLVICFQCGDVQVFRNNRMIQWFPIAKSAEPVLDTLLKAAGVELAKKAN